MAMPESKLKKIYTYADYQTFTDGERWEIIDGELYNMTPAPSTKHQRIVVILSRIIGNYLDGKTCEVFVAPFDVRLSFDSKRDEDIRNVVQPDVVVVCDPEKLDEKGCNGSPDWVIEVLSPSTAKKDKVQKNKLYRRSKVQEYWLVDPANEIVEVYKFREDNFPEAHVFSKEDTIRVGIFEDLEIELSSVFL